MKSYFIYILTNWNNTVMYIGVTNNLDRRYWEHKLKLVSGFTEKYNVTKLVYYEEFGDIYEAISREKQLKRWRREKKNMLVEKMNRTSIGMLSFPPSRRMCPSSNILRNLA